MSNSLLYVYEGFNNPGDAFSYAGARHYINKHAKVAWEQSVVIRGTRDLPSRRDISGPDLLVFAGAPWFWDACTRSTKYAGAYAFLQMHRGVPRLAVGVGSCFLADHTRPALEAIVDREAADLRAFWRSFDAIIVRDVLAWWILDRVGIRSTLAPCPSVAVGEWYGRIGPVTGKVVLSEPLEKNFIYPYLTREDETSYDETMDRWLQAGAVILPWIAPDRTTLAARSLKSMCRNVEATGASTFFTARVHAALVASGMGLGGDLMALDSRALSARLAGVNLVGRRAEAFGCLAEDVERGAPPPADVEAAIRSSLEGLL